MTLSFFHMLCLMQSFFLFFYYDCITKVSKESGSYRGTSDIGINMKYIFEMTNMSKKVLNYQYQANQTNHAFLEYEKHGCVKSTNC